jgi:hypothetical protein
VALRERELEQRAKDFRLKFYERQLATYQELMALTAKIVVDDDWTDAWTEWQKVFRSDMEIVCDHNVNIAAIDFYSLVCRKIRAENAGKKLDLTPADNFYLRASRLAVACRESLQSSFDLQPKTFGGLPQLPLRQPDLK